MDKKVCQLMQERFSTRKFISDYKISEKDMNQIVESIRMTPTSNGLFNFRIIQMSKTKKRDELNSYFYNQPNFIEASEFIFFVSASMKLIKEEILDKSLKSKFMIENIGDDQRALKMKENFINASNTRFSNNDQRGDDWSAHSVYIASGVATVAAAQLNIDTCIMEGFDFDKLNEFFRKNSWITKDEKIYLGMAFGKRDLEVSQKYGTRKVRMDINEFYKEIK